MSNYFGKFLTLEAILFGLFALAFSAVLYSYIADISSITDRYILYLLSLNGTVFMLYGADKLSARYGGRRVPNPLFHLLALLGGFVGGWFGRAIWNHKTNKDEYLSYPVVLTLSTLLHGAYIYLTYFA
ncbi:MAG: DUF1294 domain-containing protein [Anaerolineae bacterium]|nr:DUF1294 domain-containing protein [Anaerolineae bacterium]